MTTTTRTTQGLPSRAGGSADGSKPTAGVKAKMKGALGKVSSGKVAAAAGVATAAAVAGVVAKKRWASRSGASEISIEPYGDRWQVRVAGNARPSASFDLKREAVDAGRELARQRAPSVLVIRRGDGSEQTRHEYPA